MSEISGGSANPQLYLKVHLAKTSLIDAMAKWRTYQ